MSLGSITIPSAGFVAPSYLTFRMPVPIGAVPSGSALHVGSFPTQTDVKARWPDGSIKSAIVTCQASAAGTYDIQSGALVPGAYVPTWPSAAVTLIAADATYTATLPAFDGTDSWLSGPFTREARVIIVPLTSSGVPHPLLQVVFDVRSYYDQHRIDVTVQNCRDIPAMNKVTYDLVVTINGSVVSTQVGVTSYLGTRYRELFSVGYTPAVFTRALEPYFTALELPRVWSTLTNRRYDTSATSPSTASWSFDGFSTMNPQMGSPGYSAQLSPVTGPQAEYLAHQDPTQLEAVLRQGNSSGAWSMHLAHADGVTHLKVTDAGREHYWFDTRAAANGVPGPAAPIVGGVGFRGSRYGVAVGASDVDSAPDHEHVYNLAYVPYVLTGDRFYLDQMKFMSDWCILNVTPWDHVIPEPVIMPGVERSRDGAQGKLWQPGVTRELGHSLLIVAQTAAMCPDGDADASYYHDVVQHQLDALGDYITNHAIRGFMPLMGWEGGGGGGRLVHADTGHVTGIYNGQWRLTYTAVAIDYCAQTGRWTMGTATDFRDAVVDAAIGAYVNGTMLGKADHKKILVYPAIAYGVSDATMQFFQTWTAFFEGNDTGGIDFEGSANPARGCSTAWGPTPVGYHDAEALTVALIGNRDGRVGAAAYLAWLMAYPGVIADLNDRGGYTAVFSAI